MTYPPKFKIGDTIYWYCREDDCVHRAEVQFVNVAKVGNIFIEVNYEVEVECNGRKKTLFIDDYDVIENNKNNGQVQGTSAETQGCNT